MFVVGCGVWLFVSILFKLKVKNNLFLIWLYIKTIHSDYCGCRRAAEGGALLVRHFLLFFL